MSDAEVWEMFSFFRHAAHYGALTETAAGILLCMSARWRPARMVTGGRPLAG